MACMKLEILFTYITENMSVGNMETLTNANLYHNQEGLARMIPKLEYQYLEEKIPLYKIHKVARIQYSSLSEHRSALNKTAYLEAHAKHLVTAITQIRNVSIVHRAAKIQSSSLSKITSALDKTVHLEFIVHILRQLVDK